MEASMFVDELRPQWLAALAKLGRSRNTLAAYDRALTHFSNWWRQYQRTPLLPSSVRSEDVAAWMSYQQEAQQVAARTVNLRLAALSQFFHWVVRQEIIAANPTTYVSGVRTTPQPRQSLSDTEVRNLLRAVYQGRKWRDIAMLEVLLATGMRVGEMLQLRLGDVVLGNDTGHIAIRDTESFSVRRVLLPSSCQEAVAAYLDRHPIKADMHASLWWGKQGALRNRSSVIRILNKYALQAGLTHDINPTLLRHTFARNYLADHPSDLRGLAVRLGHTDLNSVALYMETDAANVEDK